MSGSGKKTRGRAKTAIKKIEDEDSLSVSFCKRRSGIYKKANELSTMCGAEFALLVYSPSGKPFSYGNPSVESVVNRYLNQHIPPNDNIQAIMEANRKESINQLIEQYNQVDSQLHAERGRSKMIGKKPLGWWDTPTDQVNKKELENLYSCFANLRCQIYGAIDEKKGEASSSMTAPAAASSHNQLTNIPFPTNANDLDQQVLPMLPPASLPGLGFGPSVASTHDQLTSTIPFPTNANDLDQQVLPPLPPASLPGLGFVPSVASTHDQLTNTIPFPTNANDVDQHVLPPLPPASLPGLGFGPGAASTHDQLTSTIPFPPNANDVDQQVLPAFHPVSLPGLVGIGPGAASTHDHNELSNIPFPTDVANDHDEISNTPYPTNMANGFDELSCILFPTNVASDHDQQVLPAFPPASPQPF